MTVRRLHQLKIKALLVGKVFRVGRTLQTMDSKVCLKKPRGQQWHKDNAGVGDTECGKNLAAKESCRRTLCY